MACMTGEGKKNGYSNGWSSRVASGFFAEDSDRDSSSFAEMSNDVMVCPTLSVSGTGGNTISNAFGSYSSTP